MWYVYEAENGYTYSREEPDAPYITTKRISPIPNKAGYTPVLQADFDTGAVWWTLEQSDDTIEETTTADLVAAIAEAMSDGY